MLMTNGKWHGFFDALGPTAQFRKPIPQRDTPLSANGNLTRLILGQQEVRPQVDPKTPNTFSTAGACLAQRP